jgi:MoxR-like ATPase
MIDSQKITRQIGRRLRLPQSGSWPETWHRLDQDSALALIAALAANRPLLVRGEPGVGKSQLARAAAACLGRRFFATVIQPHSEYQELLWAYDHTQRLADAQLAGATNDRSLVQETTEYIGPGPIWYALDWKSAAGMPCRQNYQPPLEPAGPDPIKAGVVLLIDEIDKADISLANGLLEVLGNGSFEVPPLAQTVESNGIKPLVVLTSNDTRQLPNALVRRCVVLDIQLPRQREAFIEHLVSIGQTHHEDADPDVLEQAAAQIADDRERCREQPRTGQAEYLDLLQALCEISPAPTEQLTWLDKLARYFQKSHAQR